MYLVEEGAWLAFSNAVELSDVDELEIVKEASVRHSKLGITLNVRKVAQLLVAPVVQVANATTTKICEVKTSLY